MTPKLSEAEKRGVEFFDYLGVKTLEEARAMDAQELMEKVKAYGGFWGTVEDGVFCVGDAMQLFMENKRIQCPVLWGRTSSEFFVGPEVESKEDFVAMARTVFGERRTPTCVCLTWSTPPWKISGSRLPYPALTWPFGPPAW